MHVMIARSGQPREIGANFGWLVLDQLVRLILGTIAGVWMARYLGPAAFGIYSLVLTIVTVFIALAGLSLDTLVVRDLAQGRPAEKLLGSACAMRAIASVLAAGGAIATATMLRPGEHDIRDLAFIMAISILFQPLLVIDLWFQSRYRSRFTVMARLASGIGMNLVRIALIVTKAPLVDFAVPIVIDWGVLGFGLVLAYVRQGGRPLLWRPAMAEARRLTRQGLPLLATAVAVMVQSKVDVMVMGRLVTPEALGYYGAALRITEIAGFAPMLLVASLAPLAARQALRGTPALLAVMRTAYKLNCLLCLAPAIPMLLVPGLLMDSLFGAQYRPAVPLLMLNVGRLFLTGVATVRWLYLVNVHLYWQRLATAMLGVAISIALNLLLIPRYGAYGAVVAVFLSLLVTDVLADAFWSGLRPNLRCLIAGSLTPWSFRIRELALS